MDLVSLHGLDKKSRIALLRELGYTSDGEYILDKNGNRVLDRYTAEPVHLSHMVIVPGSTIVLDDNPLSIAHYWEEYGDGL